MPAGWGAEWLARSNPALSPRRRAQRQPRRWSTTRNATGDSAKGFAAGVRIPFLPPLHINASSAETPAGSETTALSSEPDCDKRSNC